jgi:hypothetical protein
MDPRKSAQQLMQSFKPAKSLPNAPPPYRPAGEAKPVQRHASPAATKLSVAVPPVFKSSAPQHAALPLPARLAERHGKVRIDTIQRSSTSADAWKAKVAAKAAASEEAKKQQYQQTGDAERQKARQHYLDKMEHMKGEKSGKELKGGHLLLAMRIKWKNDGFASTGTQSATNAWVGTWSITGFTAKKTTFFPSGWTESDLEQKIKKGTPVGDKLELDDKVAIKSKGDTMWAVDINK